MVEVVVEVGIGGADAFPTVLEKEEEEEEEAGSAARVFVVLTGFALFVTTIGSGERIKYVGEAMNVTEDVTGDVTEDVTGDADRADRDPVLGSAPAS